MRILINFEEKNRIWNELCHQIKTLQEDRKSRMWTEFTKKIDTKQDSKDFWREINKMRGLNRKERRGTMKDKIGRYHSTEREITESQGR